MIGNMSCAKAKNEKVETVNMCEESNESFNDETNFLKKLYNVHFHNKFNSKKNSKTFQTLKLPECLRKGESNFEM